VPRPLKRADEQYWKNRNVTIHYRDPIAFLEDLAAGVSTVAMLEERPDAVIFSIDTHECPDEIKHIKEAGLDHKRVIRLLGRSQDIGIHFPYQPDLIFVDGGHLHADVLGDIQAWPHKLRPGGILAFHDYIPGENPPNNVTYVYEAIEDSGIAQQLDLIGAADRIIAFRGPYET